jgi:hypothetical protein
MMAWTLLDQDVRCANQAAIAADAKPEPFERRAVFLLSPGMTSHERRD